MKVAKISFDPNVDKDDLPSLTGFVSYRRLKQQIEDAVGLKDDEELVGLTVQDDGIVAHFKIKPTKP